jgi:hypothetical protein
VTGICDDGDEPLGSHKNKESLDQLNSYRLLKKLVH